SRNVFTECPSYQAIHHLPLRDRVARLQEPGMKEKLLRELCEHATSPLGQRLVEFTNIFDVGNPPTYDPGPERSVASIAARQGRDAADVAY
ncbi:D-aminoacylase, partial [Rhizobium sp. BUS002]|nr:D-aminoacylase [Rhizobium phaseoli]